MNNEEFEKVNKVAIQITSELLEKFNILLSKRLDDLDLGSGYQVLIYEQLLYYFVICYTKVVVENKGPIPLLEIGLADIMKSAMADAMRLPEHFFHRDKYNSSVN